MATGLVELVGTQIGSTGSFSGTAADNKAKAFDENFLTYFAAANASGDWLGWDAGGPVTPVGWLFAPRLGESSADFELLMVGGKLQGSSTSDFSSDIVEVDVIPAFPYYPARRWNYRAITGAPARRYWRYIGANGSYSTVAGLRLIIQAGGTTAAKPCQPDLSPWGGHYTDGVVPTTMASDTTSASQYYATDGSTPDNTDTLYSGQFNPNIAGGITLKAIAYDPSLDTPYSEVSTAIFTDAGFVARQDWYDVTNGNLLAVGAASLLDDRNYSGYIYMLGNLTNHFSDVASGRDGIGSSGIWLWRTRDASLLNWEEVGNILAKSGSHEYSLRAHAIRHDASSTYRMWMFQYDKAAVDGFASVASASSMEGDWAYDNEAFVPDGMATNGFVIGSLFKDDDGTAYVGYSNFDTSTAYISKLSADYKSTTGLLADRVSFASQESGPWLIKHEGFYIAILEGNDQYYTTADSWQHTYRWAASPLGPYSSTSNPVFATDPVGSDFNGQISSVFKLGTGKPIILTDFWDPTAIYNTRQVWLPGTLEARSFFIIDASPDWNVSYWNTNYPSNDFLDGLVAYYRLNEFTADNAYDSHGTRDLTQANSVGSRLAIRNRARDFTGATQKLSLADNADLSAGDVHIMFSIWVTADTKPSFARVFVKDDVSTNRDYGLYLNTSVGGAEVFTFFASNNGTAATEVAAATPNPVVNGTKYHLLAWHDPDVNKIYLSVNNGTPSEAAFAGGIFNGTADFTVGNSQAGDGPWDGPMRDLAIWKGRLPPTAAQRTALYNGGSPLPLEAFQASVDGSSVGLLDLYSDIRLGYED